MMDTATGTMGELAEVTWDMDFGAYMHMLTFPLPVVIGADQLAALDARTVQEDADAANTRRNEVRWERPALPDPRDRGQAE